MLSKIRKIENMGVFRAYTPPSDLADFARFNIIYGLNGSGKTTLSKLLSALPSGGLDDYPSLKYKIDSTEGEFTNGQTYPVKTRVFNTAYIESNIGEIEGELNPIFIVGEENKALVTQIQDDEQKLAQLKVDRVSEAAKKEKKETARSKMFTNVAKQIASEFSGQATRTYRKPQAEKAFSSLSSAELLDAPSLEEKRTTVRQEALETASNLSLNGSSDAIDELAKDLAALVSDLEVKSEAVLVKTSDSVAIQRLRENTDIASWAEKGVSLHDKHDSSRCEYCQQELPTDRIEALAKHFNQSDRFLKEEIELVIESVRSAKRSLSGIVGPAESLLYKELRARDGLIKS